jgi:elongation factor G
VKTYPPDKIRNVALVGHSGSGKTTLAEALLYRAGVISRLGRVEDGNTVMDFDPEEHKRGSSLSLAMAPFDWDGYKINLIDTPGYADFIGDVHAALRVADLAVFVVSAVDGVEVQTVNIWHLAEQMGVPRMVFVNKLDKERASFDRTLEQLQDRFGAGIAPLELPIGSEASFHGVADLFTDKAYVYDSGHGEEGEIPDDMEAREQEVHDDLVEGIVARRRSSLSCAARRRGRSLWIALPASSSRSGPHLPSATPSRWRRATS